MLPSSQKGFTLIELIVYIAIISVLLGGVISFGWDVIVSRSSAQIQQEVAGNLMVASARISHEIRNSSGINTASGSILSLSNSDSSKNPTVFDLQNDQLRVAYGTSGSCPVSSPCVVTSNLVKVSSLSFSDLSSGQSENIQYVINIEDAAESERSDFSYSEIYISSVEIR